MAPQWKAVATALGFDGARIKTIEIGSHYQPGDASYEMFIHWLDGDHDLQSATWIALIQCLRAANFVEMADMLNNTIQIVSSMHDMVLQLAYMCVLNNSQPHTSSRKLRMIHGLSPCQLLIRN